MRALGPADRGAIEAFLAARVETSMFPLSNLLRHGMGGGHPHAMEFWGWGEPVEGVLGVTEGGMVLPQLPVALAGEAAARLKGRRLTGVAGEAGQVAALREALGIPASAIRMDEAEGPFALDLAGLRRPAADGMALVPLAEAPLDLAPSWRAAANREVYGAGEAAEPEAEEEVGRWLAAGTHRVLLRDGEPVAMTGFDARLPGVVQVGAVWTPPDFRSQGLARAAVALHLEEALAEGVERAILFTANPFAARAYRALGFEEVGRFGLVLLRGSGG